MSNTQTDLAPLLSIGQSLQTALTALSDAYAQLSDQALDDPFFDGVLNEKLLHLTAETDDALDLLTLLTKKIVEQQTYDDVDRILDGAKVLMGQLESGEAFGIEPLNTPPIALGDGCDGCPVEATCATKNQQGDKR